MLLLPQPARVAYLLLTIHVVLAPNNDAMKQGAEREREKKACNLLLHLQLIYLCYNC